VPRSVFDRSLLKFRVVIPPRSLLLSRVLVCWFGFVHAVGSVQPTQHCPRNRDRLSPLRLVITRRPPKRSCALSRSLPIQAVEHFCTHARTDPFCVLPFACSASTQSSLSAASEPCSRWRRFASA
jgi:hypothetical protein